MANWLSVGRGVSKNTQRRERVVLVFACHGIDCRLWLLLLFCNAKSS